jgi:hypothetical protein
MKVLRRRDAEALVTVQTFLETMRIDAASTPAPAPTPRLAATLDGRRPLRPATDPFIVPTPARSRRDYRPFRPAAVAIAASAMLFGGLATAGALPNPVQHTSAQLGAHVGIHLPGLTQHHAVPIHPVTHGGGSGTPGAPSAHPTAKTSTPTTTGPTARTTPATTPTAVAPLPPTVPTVPSLPLPIPLPRPTLPVKTPPGLGLTLPSLPPLP